MIVARPTARYKAGVLGLLVTAYSLNFIDRTIVATIGQAIKVDLKITDAQLGLLGGLFFALFYTLMVIPIARLAERFSRVKIIAAAVFIWSGFSVLCGTAQSFLVLSLYRMGVGFGEAGLSSPAHSLLSDYYEPRRRASALSVYSLGIPIGTMIGAIAGGWLAQTFSWRIAFVIVGVPGLIVSLVFWLVVREPVRGQSDPARKPSPPMPFSVRNEFREIGLVSKSLFLNWPVGNMVLGLALASFGTYGAAQFVPPLFTRVFGLNYAQVGLITGLIGGFSAGMGTLIGGTVTDRLARRSARWYALTPAIGLGIASPLYIFAYLQDSWQTVAAILILPGIFHYTYLGPTFGVVQNMVDSRRRATASAVLFFFLNLIALGIGPPFIGWVIDTLAQNNFAHGVAPDVWTSIGTLFSPHTDGGPSFRTTCPGGKAALGASAALQHLCAASLAAATRAGVVFAMCVLSWSAVHYLIGSYGIAKALAGAQAEREAESVDSQNA